MRKLVVAVLAFSFVAPVITAATSFAKDATKLAAEKKAKPLHGQVVKVDGDKLTVKAKGAETVVTTDANTKVTDADGKDIKLADLKAGQVVNVTPAEGTAVTIAVQAPKKAK